MKPPTKVDLQRLLILQEQALGADSAEVATTLVRLADLHVEEERHDEAEKLYRRALALMENSSAPFRAEVMETRSKLMRLIQHVRGAHVEPPAPVIKQITERMEVDTLQMRRDASGAMHALSSDAVTDLEIELGLLKQTAGLDHIAVANCLTKLADIYCRKQMFEQMEPLLIEALRIREKQLGPSDLSVATSLKNLAMFYYAQKRYEMAEPLLKRALNIRRQKLRSEDATVLSTQDAYEKLLDRLRSSRNTRD
jgi:tetratricopeptide (TPR) repeat protein